MGTSGPGSLVHILLVGRRLQGVTVGFIEEFVKEYERQFDFWDATARTARGLLESELASSGLRSIVTSRAKSVDRLLQKIQQRDRQSPYPSVHAIRDDIADLAGVRVALYFPGQMDEAEQIIRSILTVHHKRTFPCGRVLIKETGRSDSLDMEPDTIGPPFPSRG